MIITLSGLPGAGKSTVAKIIAKELGLKYYSIGDLMRTIAKKRDITLMQLNKLNETDKTIDNELDEMQKKLGQEEDNLIIDGRLSFHFIPNSIKIFLDVDLDEATKRIFNDQRDTEKKYKDLEETKKAIKEREERDRKRYLNYYDIDCFDKSHFDIVLDTTNLTPDDIVKKLIKMIKEYNVSND